jgi:potassium-dependent mechanosensitive channel
MRVAADTRMEGDTRCGVPPLAVIVSAIAVNVAGYTRLADLVGGTMIRSAYVAVVFYALTRIAEGLVLGLLHIPPITLLGMVRRHRSLIAQRLNQWVRWAVALMPMTNRFANPANGL